MIRAAVAASFLCLAPCFAFSAAAADADDIAELKRAIETLRAENRALAKRLATLEAEKSEHEQAARPESTEQTDPGSPSPSVTRTEQGQLEQRVKELETEKTAQEDAVRSIIRDSLSKVGSKINESVSLGGVLEVVSGWSEDFSGDSKGEINLNTAELQFEVQANDWTNGNLVLEYVDGTDVTFPTTEGFQTGVQRINLDTAFVTIGDPQRFPPSLTAGRVILPFGLSTGNPVTDVLSIEDPLTIEAFEMRNNAVGFGLGFPTPAPTPATPPVTVPPVRPLVINPVIASLSRRLGYDPPPLRPKPPTPVTPAPAPPPLSASVYAYEGTTSGGPGQHIDATVGYRTAGHCGRPYSQLLGSKLCPWTLDVNLDYNSSVFDSRFLKAEYQGFLDQIGLVNGMAAVVRSTFGPTSLIGEWNGAIERATFIDDANNFVSIRPAAWQLSLGYQFDWNPWVEEIGGQGTFVSVGYSQSHDLAGVTELVNDEPSRVGFVPKKRLILTAGEWVLESVRFTLEYSHVLDYSQREGGTGNAGNGVFTMLTYAW
jgi:hypothetical protein